ncbi:MAG: BON domain-containing protein [Bacteroidetes bacterium]|nr:BON domain-containing protein [Bacteroidota bacterium]
MEKTVRIFWLKKQNLSHLLSRVSLLIFIILSLTLKSIAQEPEEDLEIALALEEELMRRPEVDSRLIDIGSFGGIVTLTGEVDNILAKEIAIAVARKMNGVRAVINIIEVFPPDFTDEELTDEINLRLREHEILGQKDVYAEVFGGVADLTGTVNSAYQIEMAEMLAKAVPGIIGAFSMILVEYPEQPTDEQIAQDIRFAYEQDVVIDHTKISVLVQEGTVFLTGPVVSINKIPAMIRLAMIHGVDSVDFSGLRVDPLFPDRGLVTEELLATDLIIYLSVTDAFLLDPRLAFFTPFIIVENQVITLGGLVRHLGLKLIAEETALNVVGAWAVNNLIEIDPEALETDSAITENILTAIAFDPFLAGYDLIANVLDGTVQITGTVENYFQKAHATDLAIQIPGVIEVINNIVVTKSMSKRYNGISPLDSYYQPVWWKNDFDLYNDIVDRVFWNPEIHQGDIIVEVVNGHVILRGIVDDWEHSILIERISMEEGAMTVTNKLEVRQGVL